MKRITLKQVPQFSQTTRAITGAPSIRATSLETLKNGELVYRHKGLAYEVCKAPATGGRKNGLLYLTGCYTY